MKGFFSTSKFNLFIKRAEKPIQKLPFPLPTMPLPNKNKAFASSSLKWCLMLQRAFNIHYRVNQSSLNISLACVYVVLSTGLRTSLRQFSIGSFHVSFCFDLGPLSLSSLTIENSFLCAFNFHYSLPREDDWHTQILFHPLKYCNEQFQILALEWSCISTGGWNKIKTVYWCWENLLGDSHLIAKDKFSQNHTESHRMVRLEGTTVGFLFQPPCSSRVILKHLAQEYVQMVLEYFHWGGPHTPGSVL